LGELKKRVQRIETLPEVEGDVGPITVIEARHNGFEDMTPEDITAAYAEARAEAAARGYRGTIDVDLPPKSWRERKAREQREQASIQMPHSGQLRKEQ
jgi:hypothetical protein